MKEKCSKCQGSGKVTELDTCPQCKGLGVKAFSLDPQTKLERGKIESKSAAPCKMCEGTGKIRISVDCTCEEGWRYFCEIDRAPTDSNNLLCRKCFQDPVIYELRYPWDKSILETRAVLGEVIAISGPIADIAVADIQGVLKLAQVPKGIFLKSGDKIPVMLNIASNNGRSQHEFSYVRINNFRTQTFRSKNIPLSPSFERLLKHEVNEGFIIRANAEVVNIRQTSGPTLFKLTDELGNTITGVGFIKAGQRAFAAVQEGMIVELAGIYAIHQEMPQIDLKEMLILSGESSAQFHQKALEKLKEKTRAPQIPFFVKSPIMEALKPHFELVSERIRRAIFTGQNISIKYHHPCVDGSCGSIALDLAILDLARSQASEIRSMLRRYPERGNSYEFASASRDIVSMLEEQARLASPSEPPLLILVDLGSSEENLLTYELLATYEVDVIVIDNHVVPDNVKNKLHYLINPYMLPGISEHSLSVGMLAFELGRLISADHDSYTIRLKHLPAVSGLSENASFLSNPDSEISQYMQSSTTVYSKEKLEQMVAAIDFQTFFLRSFSDGGILISELLGLGASPKVVDNLVPLLAKEAQLSLNNAIKETLINAEQSTINSSIGEVVITKIDFELTPRSGYPSPSKTATLIHDQTVVANPNKIVITLGIGFDYIIVHAAGIPLNTLSLVESIKKRAPQAGVIESGGRGRIGLIRFFAPYKKEIIELLMSEFAIAKQT